MTEAAFIIIQLVFLEGILSIDNAAVLGAMVSVLPKDKPIPWPGCLSFLAVPAHRLLGGQRSAALKVGLLGAYLGRGLMLVTAAYVVKNPWLRALGALYLLHLSSSHLASSRTNSDGEESDTGSRLSKGESFWLVVFHVELADLAFSIDNVVAAVALSREIWVVLTGVALGIVTMRFAAQLFTRLIVKEPVLETTAYILVLNISLELLIEEFTEAHGLTFHFDHWQKFLISALTFGLALGWAHSPLLRRLLNPILTALRWVVVALDALFRGLFWPFSKLQRILTARSPKEFR